MHSFGADAAAWQNFYLLTGTAAATLIGLMFVAVTFGARLVTAQMSPTARAFIDPPFYHFAHVLVTACLVIVPTMTAPLFGALLLGLTTLRLAVLVRTFRHMREAHRKFGDLELSDWLAGVVFPLVCYLVLGASGVGFATLRAAAFSGLALAILGTLVLGVVGAWELIIWMAMARTPKATDAERD